MHLSRIIVLPSTRHNKVIARTLLHKAKQFAKVCLVLASLFSWRKDILFHWANVCSNDPMHSYAKLLGRHIICGQQFSNISNTAQMATSAVSSGSGSTCGRFSHGCRLPKERASPEDPESSHGCRRPNIDADARIRNQYLPSYKLKMLPDLEPSGHEFEPCRRLHNLCSHVCCAKKYRCRDSFEGTTCLMHRFYPPTYGIVRGIG